MQQIDQDPSEYRFQKRDGSWGHRVDKTLCRWLGIVALAVVAYLAWRAVNESAGPWLVPFTAMMSFAAGALITMSLKSID